MKVLILTYLRTCMSSGTQLCTHYASLRSERNARELDKEMKILNSIGMLLLGILLKSKIKVC
jgi:hypothetical protein